MENKSDKIKVSGGAYIGTVSGLGAVGVAGSIALAGPTFGLSLLLGGISAVSAGVGSAAVVEACEAINNNKGSTIKLINEINESDGKLGKKTDYETKKYEEKYLQEVPPKQDCRIM